MTAILLGFGYYFHSHFTKDAYTQNILTYFPSLGSDAEQIKNEIKQRRYTTRFWRVYFDDDPIPNVSPIWFIALPEFWITADWRVFHGERLLTGVDGNTLTFYRNNRDYIKDKNASYSISFRLRKVEHIGELQPFTGILQGYLAKDDKYLYAAGRRVEWADPNDISFIDNRSRYYFFSNWKVFHRDQQIIEADIETFTGYSESSNMIYAEDKNYIYKNWDIRKVK